MVVSETQLIGMTLSAHENDELMIESSPNEDEDMFSTFHQRTNQSTPGMRVSKNPPESFFPIG
jgi:hypothetical protein